MSQDILFKTDEFVFSYRVAGLILKNNKVLLQRPLDETGYAIPGGHVAFGETNKANAFGCQRMDFVLTSSRSESK